VWSAVEPMEWREVANPIFVYPLPGYADWFEDGAQVSPAPGQAPIRYYRISVE